MHDLIEPLLTLSFSFLIFLFQKFAWTFRYYSDLLAQFTKSNVFIRSPEKFVLFYSSSVGSDSRPVVLINPNIKIQTESLSAKKTQDHRKKSLIDSGLDLLFKKHPKSVKDGLSPSSKQLAANEFKFQPDVVLENKEQQQCHPDKRWKPFDSIKIYTDKMKGHEDHHKGINGLKFS